MQNTQYIDKETIIKFIQQGLNSNEFGHDAVEILAEIEFTTSDPDVVKVVRCKDCKHCEDQGMAGLWCNHSDNRNPIGCLPDEFCNNGESK